MSFGHLACPLAVRPAGPLALPSPARPADGLAHPGGRRRAGQQPRRRPTARRACPRAAPARSADTWHRRIPEALLEDSAGTGTCQDSNDLHGARLRTCRFNVEVLLR
jgi:hypothetical protein